MANATLREHQHGKSRVRLGRTWREEGKDASSGIVRHHFVEWTVETVLESEMAHAFLSSSNAGMTATDTQKNAVSGDFKWAGGGGGGGGGERRRGLSEKGRRSCFATSSPRAGEQLPSSVLSFSTSS